MRRHSISPHEWQSRRPTGWRPGRRRPCAVIAPCRLVRPPPSSPRLHTTPQGLHHTTRCGADAAVPSPPSPPSPPPAPAPSLVAAAATAAAAAAADARTLTSKPSAILRAKLRSSAPFTVTRPALSNALTAALPAPCPCRTSSSPSFTRRAAAPSAASAGTAAASMGSVRCCGSVTTGASSTFLGVFARGAGSTFLCALPSCCTAAFTFGARRRERHLSTSAPWCTLAARWRAASR